MPQTPQQYALEIMSMIRSDMAEGTVPCHVHTFTDLHDYVDANEYLTQAGVPSGADDNSGYSTANAVAGQVDRWLRVSLYRCPCCGDDVMSTGPVCSECQDAQCETSTSADGDPGWWNCQRDTTCSD